MKVSIYAATCPKCGYRAIVHSRNQPPGCACSVMTKTNCDGVLGPWMFIAEAETRAVSIEGVGSVTLSLGGGAPLFETVPLPPVEPEPHNNPFDRYSPPGVTMDDVETAEEVKRNAATREAQERDEPPSLKDTNDLAEALKARDYFMAESKRNADAARKLYARNRELDRLNGDLHDQIRARDRTIDDQVRMLATRDQRNSDLQRELAARQGDPKVYDAAMNSRDELIQKLSDAVRDLTADRDMTNVTVARQERMLDNAAILLEAGASTIDTAQKALDKAQAKLEQCEAALTEARMQRDYSAKNIDKLNADIATLQKITRDPADKRATSDRLKTERDKLNACLSITTPNSERFDRFAGAYSALKWALDPASFAPVSET